MYLTEEQVISREDAFIDFLNQATEELHESTQTQKQMTEKQAFIMSVVMDHFVNNYNPMLSESGEDQNEELYEEVADFITEAGLWGAIKNLGSAVKGAVNAYGSKQMAGFKHGVANVQNKSAQAAADKAADTHAGHVVNAQNSAAKATQASRSGSTVGTLAHGVAAAISKARAVSSAGKANDTEQRAAITQKNVASKQGVLGAKTKQANAANRNVKVAASGVKDAAVSAMQSGRDAIHAGASRFLGAIKRGVGRAVTGAAHGVGYAAGAAVKGAKAVANSSVGQAVKSGYAAGRA